MACTVRQQATTWANVESDLCRYMTSLGHNVLILHIIYTCICKTRACGRRVGEIPISNVAGPSIGIAVTINLDMILKKNNILNMFPVIRRHHSRRTRSHEIYQIQIQNLYYSTSVLIVNMPAYPRLKVINSLGPRAAYMHHQTRPSLFQKMACRMFGAKPLSEPMLDRYQWHFNEILIKIQQFFTEENVFDNIICKMSAILSRPHCVKTLQQSPSVAMTL